MAKIVLSILVLIVGVAIPGITGSYYSLCPTNDLYISTPVFTANIMSILDDIPAAAVPTGYASLRFGAEPTPAYVHGLCFADNPSPQQCLGCLQATVAEMKARNCTHTWSAGIWADDCFLGYSVSNFTSAFEQGFRRLNFTAGDGVEYPRFYEREELENLAKSLSLKSNDEITSNSGATANTTTRGTSKVRAVAHCARDRAKDCGQCVMDSALYLEGCERHGDYQCGYLDGRHAGVAAVIGFNCYLRVEISPPPTSHTGSLRFLFLYQLIGMLVYSTMM